MCTHASHTIFSGNCLCGTIKEGIYCAARGRAYYGLYGGPPVFKPEGYEIITNEKCCKNPNNCERINEHIQ